MKHLFIFTSVLLILASFAFLALAGAGLAEVKAALARHNRTGR